MSPWAAASSMLNLYHFRSLAITPNGDLRRCQARWVRPLSVCQDDGARSRLSLTEVSLSRRAASPELV